MLKRNMGGEDRLIRTLAALAFATLYFVGATTGTLAMLLLFVALLLLVTSMIGFCPLYVLLGVDTCRRQGE